MQIREVMTQAVVTCQVDTNLAEAATLMWEKDCGVLPVIDDEQHVLGLLTDRDICMAVVTRNRLASDIKAGEVITKKVYGCAAEDDVTSALKIMQMMQVRRIPVISKDRLLQGILSLSDLAQKADKDNKRNGGISYDDVMLVLKAVSEAHQQNWKEQAQHG